MVRKFPLLILLILFTAKIHAQQDFFVLLQADHNQPFYIHLGDKTYNSSAGGHLILSQLKEGAYTMSLGFPRMQLPEEQFSIAIAGRDLEFQVKDLGDKGWGLLDTRTQELKMPDKKGSASVGVEGIKKDDAFSRLMAGVVNDTAVMYNDYAVAKPGKDTVVRVADTVLQPGKAMGGMPIATVVRDTTTHADLMAAAAVHTDSVNAVIQPDSAGIRVVNQSVNQTVSQADSPVVGSNPAIGQTLNASISQPVNSSANQTGSQPASPTAVVPGAAGVDTTTLSSAGGLVNQAVSPTVNQTVTPVANQAVAKISEQKTSKGLSLVYADQGAGKKTDTIDVVIPSDNQVETAGTADHAPLYRPAKPKQVDSAGTVAEKPASGGGMNGTAAVAPAGKGNSGKLVVVNSDCKNFATDYDVDRLRVRMLEIGKDEDRILAAKKVFKTKCFTTKQIKALTEVFTGDAVKYRFLESAYPFVSDSHFSELSGVLADPVYNGKFRAMTGQ